MAVIYYGFTIILMNEKLEYLHTIPTINKPFISSLYLKIEKVSLIGNNIKGVVLLR